MRKRIKINKNIFQVKLNEHLKANKYYNIKGKEEMINLNSYSFVILKIWS